MTKLRAPTMSDQVVERARITALLDRAVESSKSLALVSAPAGAGKSTALATWLAGRDDLTSVWVQIDGRDNDPIRFWGGLATALADVDPGIDRQVLSALRVPGTSFSDVALPVLVNALDGDGSRVAIVLDDYHQITSQEVHDDVQNLVDALPDRVTLVISSRVDPPLRLGRLRVKGQLIEIRAHDLAFDVDEAAVFFTAAPLRQVEIDALCARTEGWAAGLVLAAASLVRSDDPASFVASFAGDNRLVVDYLATELWNGLPIPMRDVLLATSILNQMCGPLVDAVAGIDDGVGWLEELAHENQLVISLDDHRHWYRYHHLLRDLLRQELERTRRDELVSLHHLAATWFIASELYEDAIHHAFGADDPSTAAALVASEGHKTLEAGHVTTLQNWLDQLGPDVVHEQLPCAVLQMWILVITGRFDDVAPWIETCELLLTENEGGDATPFMVELIAGAAAITALASGDVGAALNAAERIIANTGDHELTSLAANIVGDCWTWAGRIAEARPLLETSGRNASIEGQHLIACTSWRDLAIGAIEDDDQGRARHLADQALDYAETHHLTGSHQLALAHSVLARTSLTEDQATALTHADLGVDLARRSNRPLMLAYALASRAEVATADQRTDAARIDLTEARRLLHRCPDPGMVLTFVARREANLGRNDTPQQPRTSANLVEQLTPRELTVLRLLPSRLNVTEIAEELYLSPNTVRGHVKAIYRKLGVNGRALAVQRARELRLL